METFYICFFIWNLFWLAIVPHFQVLWYPIWTYFGLFYGSFSLTGFKNRISDMFWPNMILFIIWNKYIWAIFYNFYLLWCPVWPPYMEPIYVKKSRYGLTSTFLAHFNILSSRHCRETPALLACFLVSRNLGDLCIHACPYVRPYVRILWEIRASVFSDFCHGSINAKKWWFHFFAENSKFTLFCQKWSKSCNFLPK